MKKRKRTNSLDRGKAKAAQNPFLLHEQDTSALTKEQVNQQLVLQNVLAFSDFVAKQRTNDYDGDTESPSNGEAALELLLDFLERHRDGRQPSGRSGATSADEIALMISPWTIKRILSAAFSSWQGSNLLVWRAASVTLHHLAQTQDPAMQYALSQQVLTQSTLYKLCPSAAIFALSTDEHEDEEMKAGRVLAASVGKLLIENFFRPTLDVAAKTLLIPLARQLAARSPTGTRTERGCATDTLVAPLRLLVLLLKSGKGNPRTTFQLFASKEVLLALGTMHSSFEASNCDEGNELILKILSDALFHPRHHMDGFYSVLHKALLPRFSNETTTGGKREESMDSQDTKKFRSYQEELIASVNGVLTKGDGSDQQETGTQELTMIHFVPLMFQCFLNQSRSWDNHRVRERKKRKSSREEDLSRIQFQLFAIWTVPLQSILVPVTPTPDAASNSRVVSNQHVSIRAALRSLRRMLELLLEHNSYTPSQDDSQHANFVFLDEVTKQILRLMCPDPELHASLLVDAIPALALLLGLNHLLVQDKVKQTLMFCVQDGSKSHTVIVGSVFTELFNTYRKLRQQDFLFCAILDVLDEFCAQKEANRIQHLGSILRLESAASSIAISFQECPIVQAKEIFDCLDEWIRRKCSREHYSEISSDSLCVASELVSLATQNIRVERSTASVIADIAWRFMEGAVLSLEKQSSQQEEDTSRRILQDVTMKICAWLLELHGRCTFWLGKCAGLDIPDNILSILESSLIPSRGPTSRPDVTDGMILLGCHRLRNLHSLIHEHEDSLILGRREYSILSQHLESAKRLSGSISFAANSGYSSNRGSLWSIVAENFVFWAQYAEETHFHDFLKWICSSLSMSATSGRLKRDTEIARALVSDASFLDDVKVRENLWNCALSLSLDMIVKAIGQLDDRCSRAILNTLQEHEGSMVLVDLLAPLGKDAIGWERPAAKRVNELGMCVKKIAQLISVATRLPLVSHPSLVARNVHQCCSLDFAFRSVATLGGSVCWHDIVSTMNGLRGHLCDVTKSDFEPFAESNRKHYVRMLESILEASFNFVEGCTTRAYADSFCKHTGELFEHLVQFLLSQDPEVTNLDSLFQTFARVAHKKKSEIKSHGTMASFGSIVTGIVRKNYESFENHMGSVQPLIDQLWVTVQVSIQKGLDDVYDSLYMASDLLQVKYQPEFVKTFRETLETYCVQVLESSDDSKESLSTACSYLLGSLARPNTVSARNKLFTIVVRSNRRDPVLHAAFCQLVQFLSTDEMDLLVQDILSAADTSMHLVLLILKNVNDKTLLELLSKSSRRIFASLLMQLTSADDDTANSSLALLDGMIQRRDILVFRELDLATILSSVASFLAKRDPHARELACSTFGLCCALVASMQQRYSKVLYACAPSVVVLYARLMEHVMFGPGDDSGNQRVRHYARICEILVPHKDVYKKHVLGLVLQFVARGLPEMTLDRREALIPAVYYLLDVLSTYETQQLNACMDSQHRMQFRTIYQSYQKVHSYRGQ